MKRLVLTFLLSILLGLMPAGSAKADTTADVTVTAVPSFIAITNSPNTWTINGITGSGVIATSTTYYTNPLGDTTAPSATVVDGECRFTVTNTSTVAIDLTVNMGNFTGGDAMTNGDTGSAGGTSYGAYAWVSGATYATEKQILKSAASTAIKTSLAASTNIKWGISLSTRTTAWSTGDTQTATATITATAS
ncbi:MAG: hypothetical protein HYX79_07345 [Chloroflexi bacterium]|nr:hypothetical protein [Chloroflexota bacterium]